MSALVFLGIAAVLSVVGCGILWLRSRQPGSMEAHINEFARELDALAPGSLGDRARRASPRNQRGGLDRLPDQGAGPERPARPTLPPERRPGAGPQRGGSQRGGPGPERPRPSAPPGPGPERPSGRGPGPEWPSAPGSRPRSG